MTKHLAELKKAFFKQGYQETPMDFQSGWPLCLENLEKHLKNSMLVGIYMETSGKIFPCWKKKVTAFHEIDFFQQCALVA